MFLQRYKHRGIDASNFSSFIGESKTEYKKFEAMLLAMIEQMIQHAKDGTPNKKIRWDSLEKKVEELITREITEDVMEDPDDEYWDYDFYVEKKGDPSLNGLGHRVVEDGSGKKEVIVPGPPIRKRKRRQVMSSEILCKADDGKMLITPNQLREKKAEFEAMNERVKGTGKYRSLALQGSEEKKTSSSPQAAGSADSRGPAHGGFGHKLIMASAPEKAKSEAESDEGSELPVLPKGKRRRGAKAGGRRATPKRKAIQDGDLDDGNPAPSPGSRTPVKGGRPSTDLLTTLAKMEEQFQNTAKDDAQLYGTHLEVKNWMQTFDRRDKDLSKAEEVCKDIDKVEELSGWRKRFDSFRALYTALIFSFTCFMNLNVKGLNVTILRRCVLLTKLPVYRQSGTRASTASTSTKRSRGFRPSTGLPSPRSRRSPQGSPSKQCTSLSASSHFPADPS